jgi:membrane protease YdiL (CAAX protease family)
VPELALVIIGGLGPMAAATLLTARRAGRSGVGGLFRQLDPRGVQRRWFAAALVLLPVSLSPVLLDLATGGSRPAAATWVQVLALVPVQMAFVAVVGGGLDEEMGWRGYALPRLLRTRNPLPAHLLLGAVWACWHLPLWLDPSGTHAAYPFWLYLLITMGQSVIIGWLYAASGGNLTVAIVAHAVANSGDGARYQLLGAASRGLESQLCLAVVTTFVAVLVVVATRGRLGADRLQLDRFDDGGGELVRPRAPATQGPPASANQ